ncbi:MBL fold metallo-hydrolase [Brevundimonas sp.]|uniref:MBL fold metallo-hydrolase n=1 Tax=Brevundimonas sp. TaxID=1871086 RepID=UPI003D0FD549
MTTQFKLAAALILSGMIVAGCQKPADKAEAPAAPAAPAAQPVASTDIYPFQIGALQAVALKDGTMSVPLADTPWSDHAGVRQVLTAAGLPGDTVNLSIQPLLLRDGDRVVLIDTGNGAGGTPAGHLMTSLREAGVQPAQVTDVLISHAHGDHVGGLVGTDGKLSFPNATIRMSAAEWDYAKAGAEAAGAGPLLAAITPRVETFEPGAQVTPSITAVALQGHTPGHTGYEIVSGQDRLLYLGDALHSSVISVERPDFVNTWDSDSDAAIATRLALLGRGATQSLRVYGVHFPFPGLGAFRRQDDGFVWVPEVAAQP